MTTPGNNDDKELKEYLAGNSDLSHVYKQHANEQPSIVVDATIHAAARSELNAGRQHIINPFGQQWTAPVSIAALFLLSIGLVTFMSDETGTPGLATDLLEERIIEHDIAIPLPRLESNAASSPAPAAGKRQDKKDSSIKSERSFTRPKVTKPAAKRKLLKKSRSGRTAGESQLKPQKTAPTTGFSDVAKPMRQMEMKAPATPTAGAAGAELSPEDWLRQIQALRDQGKDKEAGESLEKFRKTYPDYSIDSLRN